MEENRTCICASLHGRRPGMSLRYSRDPRQDWVTIHCGLGSYSRTDEKTRRILPGWKNHEQKTGTRRFSLFFPLREGVTTATTVTEATSFSHFAIKQAQHTRNGFTLTHSLCPSQKSERENPSAPKKKTKHQGPTRITAHSIMNWFGKSKKKEASTVSATSRAAADPQTTIVRLRENIKNQEKR